MAMKFKPSYRGIGQMLIMPEIQADMIARATRVAAQAVADAPVDADRDDAHRGRYKASFKVSGGIRSGSRGGRRRRAYGRVTNDAPEAIDVEYGTRDTPRHHTLAHALRAAGDR